MALQDDIEFAISTNVMPVYVVGRDDLEIMGEADAAAKVVELIPNALRPALMDELGAEFGMDLRYDDHMHNRFARAVNAAFRRVIGDK